MNLTLYSLLIVAQLATGTKPASQQEKSSPRRGQLENARQNELGPPRDILEKHRRLERERAERQARTERWNETWGWTVYPLLTVLVAYTFLRIYLRHRCPNCRRMGCHWTGKTEGFSLFSWGRDEMKCKYCGSTKWARHSSQ